MSVKLSRTELASLLGMGPPVCASPVPGLPDPEVVQPQPAPGVDRAMAGPAPAAPSQPVAQDAPVQARTTGAFNDERHASAYLKKVLSGLWHKVEAERLTRAEQRARLLHLLQWAAGKNGWQLQTCVAQRYAEVGRQVEGKLWLTLTLSEHARFALELTFEARQAPLAKLHAARHAGWIPLLLMPGEKSQAERMEELHRTSGDERLAWLQVLALSRPA